MALPPHRPHVSECGAERPRVCGVSTVLVHGSISAATSVPDDAESASQRSFDTVFEYLCFLMYLNEHHHRSVNATPAAVSVALGQYEEPIAGRAPSYFSAVNKWNSWIIKPPRAPSRSTHPRRPVWNASSPITDANIRITDAPFE